MRFLVDECTGSHVARHLSALGHDVFSVFDSARGDTDDEVLARALAEQRILITNDRDFGDAVFRDGKLHCGIVLLRLEVEITGRKIAVLDRLLAQWSAELPGRFVVVSESRVRFRPPL
jgi:predicted nuclease of predicted toxin-antitoxin system